MFLTYLAVGFLFYSEYIAKAEGYSAVIGAGTNSCGKWVEAKNDPAQRYQYTQWLYGFISGHNWYIKQYESLPPDKESAVLWVDNYCKNNPLHAIIYAATALVQETGGTPTKHEWK